MFSGGKVDFDPKVMRAVSADLDAVSNGQPADVTTDIVRDLFGLSPAAGTKLTDDRIGNNGFVGGSRFLAKAPPVVRTDPNKFIADAVKLAFAHFKASQGK